MEFLKTLILNIVLFFLRKVRDAVDYFSEIVFGWIYRGKHVKLPRIKDQCLLEPAHIVAAKIRRRQLTSSEVIKAYIHRIKEVQPIVNAIVDDRFSEAILEAQAIDEFLKGTLKTEAELAEETPFLGVPVTIKEAIAVKGCLFTVGLPARKGVRAEIDSDAATRLKKAGAIPIAVTITPELCFWWESYNTLYGRCCNPYDTTRTAGGSSGGEGCILGCAGSVIGVGNDIGGSIRIPACFNGVFGHKPSRGVVSNYGQYPPAGPSLQKYLIAGPMCRYASDLLPMMKVLSDQKFLKLDSKVNFSDLKIFFMENEGGNPFVSAVHPEILEAQSRLMQYFKETYGIEPVKVKIPHVVHSFEIWSKIITASGMNPSYEMTGRAGEPDLAWEILKWCIPGCSDHVLPVLVSAVFNKIWAPENEKDAMKYFKMMYAMEEYFKDLLGKNGIFIYPTSPDLPPYHGQPLLKPFSVSYTAIFNLLGLPVSQCPLGLSSNGLPIGLQIVGNHYCDHITIAVAEEIEKVFGGWICP
ncbi:Fatty-acid amide hydrolase 2 like protein [Argiope bruennichi]|uniref:Fatty-acid amide hydrolase 2 like protein n=1 Tax=Argiope bruennichi TaxID=94029 RepID=A0A8T0EP62_ARGBR|nr:Fatty-acid amide hydrolase 2 like protein [Argiope bruennichi]